MPRHPQRVAQAGFSLIELMIAMVITLIVTGSIYGLIAQGGNAFRRDPEITDRQQALRIALDLLTRDLDIAGMRMGAGTQAFTNNLDAVGPLNQDGVETDFIEILGDNGSCPDVYINPAQPSTGSNINTVSPIPDCYPEPTLVFIIFDDGATKWGAGHKIHAADQKLNFPPGQQPTTSQVQGVCDLNNSDAGCTQAATPLYVALLTFVRWEIADDTDGIPSLYRATSAGIDLSSGAVSSPPGAGWSLVARGIEDLQVQYFRESDATDNNQSLDWFDTPGVVDATGSNLDTLVRQVRVTLQARTVSTNLQGSTAAAAGDNAIRGSMTTVVAPRAAHFYLATVGDMPWR